MRRLLACLLTVALLFGCARAEKPGSGFSLNGTAEAREIRSHLMSGYLVTILIGDECLDVKPKGFKVSVSPDGKGSAPAIRGQNARYEVLIRLLEQALSVYSPFFFYEFCPKDVYKQGGISFMLVNSITYKDCSEAGYFLPDGNWMRIWLSASACEEWAVHHEIWHAIETKILREDPKAFADWEKLNPEGFAYSRDAALVNSMKAHLEPDDWFVRGYGMSNVKEDRATVYEAIVTREEAWWADRPHLRKKADYLLNQIRGHFANWPFAEE